MRGSKMHGAANEVGYPQALQCGRYEPKSVARGSIVIFTVDFPEQLGAQVLPRHPQEQLAFVRVGVA